MFPGLDALPELLGGAVCARSPGHGLPGLGADVLPLCARCAGLHVAAVASWFTLRPTARGPGGGALRPLLVAAALEVPMALDVATVHLGLWGGANGVRALTGIVGGIGVGLALGVGEGLARPSEGSIRFPEPEARSIVAGLLVSLFAVSLAAAFPARVGRVLTAGGALASFSLVAHVALGMAGGSRLGASRLRPLVAAALAGVLLLAIGAARQHGT